MRTWDCEIQLFNEVVDGKDADGFPVVTTTLPTTVLANKLPVHSSEFYHSSKEGYIISKVFEIHAIEYDGETSVIYDGQSYQIRRQYENGEFVEISCERRDVNYG